MGNFTVPILLEARASAVQLSNPRRCLGARVGRAEGPEHRIKMHDMETILGVPRNKEMETSSLIRKSCSQDVSELKSFLDHPFYSLDLVQPVEASLETENLLPSINTHTHTQTHTHTH